MTVEEQGISRQQEQGVKQATITLPYFDEEVPVIYLADGAAYLPVRPLCRMLGLRPEIYIPRWKRLVLWANARKLPLQTARGERLVWCLHMGALPFWCVCFNWSLVPAKRCEQLRQANDAWQEDVAQAQQLLLERYRSLRRDLYVFLDAYSDAETWLDHLSTHLYATLDAAFSHRFEMLLSQGKTLISQTTAHARKIVQEQAMAPIIDIIMFDECGGVTETDTQSLFPVVPDEDRERFFASVRELAQWHREVAAFIGGLKRLRDSDHSREV